MIDLNKYRARTYSQNCEDGMCLRMLETIGITKPTYCEIGAGDGRELSNTRLFYERGARGAISFCGLTLLFASVTTRWPTSRRAGAGLS